MKVSNPEEISKQGKAAATAAPLAFLRAIADWLEAHPEVRRPYELAKWSMPWSIYTHTRPEFTLNVKQAGSGVKDLTDAETARFYPDLGAFTGALAIQCSKAEVCERVQIGTRYVAEQPRREEIRVVEAVPAHEEPLYRYVCGNPWTEEEGEQEEESADAADVA